MNRRTLFKTVAAGMAWLAGKKLPAVEQGRSGHAIPYVPMNIVVTKNVGDRKLNPGDLVFWTYGGVAPISNSTACLASGVVVLGGDDKVVIQTRGACQIRTA